MPKTILIVDDDTTVRNTLVDLFREFEYKVIEAPSGEEALEKVHSEKPDLVLLDTKLPRMNGIEVCRQIKMVEKLDIKIIVYTGKIDAINQEKAKQAGADEYCIKGTEPIILIDTVKRLI